MPTCVHIDLIDTCHNPAAAQLTDGHYCPEHAVIVLCERHPKAITGARCVIDTIRPRP